VLVTKIVGLAGVRDGNSITLWGTNNLSGEVTYGCLSVSRLVLSSLHVIWHGASSRWRGVQLEPLVAFVTPESVLLTIHSSHPIYHSPYTRRAPSLGDKVTTVTRKSRWANQFLQLRCTLCAKQIHNSTGLAQHYRNDYRQVFDDTGEAMERHGTEANLRSSK
jgi:hypothetical protein